METTQTGTQPEQTTAEPDTTTQETTETPATTDVVEPEVVLDQHQLVVDDSGFSTDAFVEATVINEGDGPSGRVELAVQWHDGNGNFLDSTSEYLVSLAPGETWHARVDFIGTQAEVVADYEIDGGYENTPPTVPQGVELLGSSLQVGDTDIRVTGRVRNGTRASLSYLEAHAKLIDGAGNVLESNLTNQSQIPEGQTWAFEVLFFMPDRWNLVADHAVVLSDSL